MDGENRLVQSPAGRHAGLGDRSGRQTAGRRALWCHVGADALVHVWLVALAATGPGDRVGGCGLPGVRRRVAVRAGALHLRYLAAGRDHVRTLHRVHHLLASTHDGAGHPALGHGWCRGLPRGRLCHVSVPRHEPALVVPDPDAERRPVEVPRRVGRGEHARGLAGAMPPELEKVADVRIGSVFRTVRAAGGTQ